MRDKDMMLLCLILLFLASHVRLFASSSCIVDPEFANTQLMCAPLAVWESAGSNALIDSVVTINVAEISDTIFVLGTNDPIPDAQTVAGFDNSLTFNELIKWINTNIDSLLVHTQIYIPEGIYHFNDQIVLNPNISLKGEGSHLTELRFLINADPEHTTMSGPDCKKDAVLVSGTDDNHIYGAGIEDLKIIRIREGLTPGEVKDKVGEREAVGGIEAYWGNNIAIRRATNCWVKGVESDNPFRNHVTLELAEHVTVSGVYFHHANDYGGNGFGYGVGLWDSSNNLVENSIFRHVRHAVTISDSSWVNVIAYNYSREQYSTALFGLETEWSDIAIHGEATNTYHYEHNAPTVPEKTPTYNLIEGNNLEYLCVDATHMENGALNTFLRNRVTKQIHVQGYDGFPDALTTMIAMDRVHKLQLAKLIDLVDIHDVFIGNVCSVKQIYYNIVSC